MHKHCIVVHLRRAYLAQSTGTLGIREGGATKRLYFIEGELYLPRSHPLVERLDGYLLAAGPDAAPTAQWNGEAVLRDMTDRIARHLSSWEVESVSFTEGPLQPETEFFGPLPTVQLLLSIASLRFEERQLVERLGGVDGRIGASASKHASFESDLGPDETYLLSELGEPRGLRTLLDLPAVERQRWLLALARLWALDLVRPAGSSEQSPLNERRLFETLDHRPAELPPAALPSAPREHFQLANEPFSLTPDPNFFFLSTGHAEMLAGLKLGLLERRGLIVATGEVGTGKSTLLYSLLEQIEDRVETAYISNTALTFVEILESALRDFGAPLAGHRRLDLLDALNSFLLASAEKGKIVALIVDEAQNLSDRTFEELRLLLNFETYSQKLLQIILVGQPELGSRLRAPHLRQIADRIAVRCDLGPLNPSEVLPYIDHRVRAAGGSDEIFTNSALKLLVRRSHGIPRRINVLCHNSLLFAYGEGLPQVKRSHVVEAARGMRQLKKPRLAAVSQLLNAAAATPRRWTISLPRRVLLASLVGIGLAIALLLSALSFESIGADTEGSLEAATGTETTRSATETPRNRRGGPPR